MDGMAPILRVAEARASIEWCAQLGFEVESEHTFGPDWPPYVRLRCGRHSCACPSTGSAASPAAICISTSMTSTASYLPRRQRKIARGMREARRTDPEENQVRVGSALRNPVR
jgi:hypothetical protein